MSGSEPEFDAIVVGSGVTGGWAAKELTEKGLKVLMIERGRAIEHQTDYTTETVPPWEMPFHGFGDKALYERDYPIQSKVPSFDEWSQSHFVNDRENPYQTDPANPFKWTRAYQLGGRSLIWGRQCYRWSDIDFGANAADGHGVDWPIRYRDLAPWYDHVEEFIGVSGNQDHLEQLPDGRFQPPMAMNAVEKAFKAKIETAYPTRRLIIGRAAHLTEDKEGRMRCQYRGVCARGCSFGAYFSTQSSTLPAARATGRLTLLTDQVVESVTYDPKTKRVTGVRTIDTKTRATGAHTARIFFLCAGSVNSISVLLRSASESMPHGLANSSGALGLYFMDHALTGALMANPPGFSDHGYFGNRPNGILIPRYVNATEPDPDLLRGFAFQGAAVRRGWGRGKHRVGIGKEFKKDLRGPGDWMLFLGVYAECLPDARNRVTLDHKSLDPLGMPQTRIELTFRENERKLVARAARDAREMAALLKAEVLASKEEPGPPGSAIHEMGGARMGHDPATSVLNRFNQAHDVPNLFVTDGAAMASSAVQNPSLTYMALTARASDHAVAQLKAGRV